MTEIDEDERARFWRFVCERDAIWRRREIEGLPEPWTDDPILREYHVTNVHRYKDPGTRWIVAHLDSHDDEPLDDLLCVYAYRSLNRLDVFEDHDLPDRSELAVRWWLNDLRQEHDGGRPLGSKRHLTFFARLERRLPTLVDAYDLADAVWAAPDGIAAIKVLMKAHLDVGPFLGTQVVADLVTGSRPGLTMTRHTPVPVSGGSRYGLRLIAGLLTRDEVERRAYAELTSAGRATRNLRLDPEEQVVIEDLLTDQPTGLSEPLTWIDLEHSLCEYARYSRLVVGDMTRRKYMLRDPS